MTTQAEETKAGKGAAGGCLVACNEGPSAAAALQRAAGVAPLLGGSARVLRVCDLGTDEAGLEQARAALAAEAQERFEGHDARCETVARIFPDFYHDEEAGRAACVLGEAESCGASLIVLGVHRSAPQGEPLLGTMTQRLLADTKEPVLIAKADSGAPYEKALIAVDFSDFTPLCLDAAALIAPRAEHVLVHAYQPSLAERLSGRQAAEEARAARLDGLVEERRNAGHDEMRGSVKRGAPKAVLEGILKEEKPDLLVLGTHGRLGAARAGLGSTALGLIENPPCDLLIVPAR